MAFQRCPRPNPLNLWNVASHGIGDFANVKDLEIEKLSWIIQVDRRGYLSNAVLEEFNSVLLDFKMKTESHKPRNAHTPLDTGKDMEINSPQESPESKQPC